MENLDTLFRLNRRSDIDDMMDNNHDLFTSGYENKIDMFELNIKRSIHIKNEVSIQDENVKSMSDIFGNINMIQVDLLSIVYYMFYEKRILPKIYLSRQSVLLIYESLNDFDAIRGKVRKILNEHIANSDDNRFYIELIDRTEIFKNKILQFKNKNFDYLKEIRMNIIGHRDPDFGKQIEVMSQSDPYAILGISMYFDEIIQSFNDILYDYLTKHIKFED
ncbi:MAG: hypothetical protein BGO33_08770 [Bacteroidia bacterium 43-41]|nr:MAG: hypothetical protein BGO33_08770 [Bacteroidia bacterium 43-41]